LPSLLLLALLVGDPQVPTAAGVVVLRGSVVTSTGEPVEAANVTLACGDWAQSRITTADGAFVFADVPAGACRLRVETPGPHGSGVDLFAEATTDVGDMRVVLPAALVRPAKPDAGTVGTPVSRPLRFDFLHSTVTDANRAASSQLRLSSRWRAGSSQDAADARQAPGPRPAWQDWSAALSALRPGPWGSLIVGTAGVRRTSGAVSLLSDVTGTAVPGGTAWSSLVNPAKPPTIWDVRLRLERSFSLPGAQITAFGELYQSFEPTTTRDFSPRASGTTAPARTGGAVRGGATIRW
jgi:hypothetical protein